MSECANGRGRSDFDAMVHSVAMTDSSPRRDAMTRPVMMTKSPMSTSAFQAASASSPTSFRLSMACSCVPSPSCSVAKHSLPVLRTKMTRPTTVTTSCVSSPASSCHWLRTCASVCVRGTSTGYASPPSASSFARLSRRMRSCSGRSVVGFWAWFGAGFFASVTVSQGSPLLDDGISGGVPARRGVRGGPIRRRAASRAAGHRRWRVRSGCWVRDRGVRSPRRRPWRRRRRRR